MVASCFVYDLQRCNFKGNYFKQRYFGMINLAKKRYGQVPTAKYIFVLVQKLQVEEEN